MNDQATIVPRIHRTDHAGQPTAPPTGGFLADPRQPRWDSYVVPWQLPGPPEGRKGIALPTR